MIRVESNPHASFSAKTLVSYFNYLKFLIELDHSNLSPIVPIKEIQWKDEVLSVSVCGRSINQF